MVSGYFRSGLLKRNGKVYTEIVSGRAAKILQSILRGHVSPDPDILRMRGLKRSPGRKEILEDGSVMKEYRYFAFISYKREDEKWAKWLQRKLEAYRLPSVLQKQYKNARFRLNGDLINNSQGYVSCARQYDQNGYARLTCEYYDGNAGYEMTYWGADGKPVNTRDGYAHYVRRIDEKTGKYAETYYDADGKEVAIVR